MQAQPQSPDASPVRTGTLREAKNGLPLLLRPNGRRDSDSLSDYLRRNRDAIYESLRRHGAILMRGFQVFSPEAFERIALAIDSELKNEYLGTSPRDALTKYVFSASELPGYYPIPQHCEMSFVKNHPRRIFFCCLIAPQHGGETPLVDFRRVYTDLDPQVRQRFVERGIRVVRNYSGPDEVSSRFDLWQLKPWNDMFGTTDRDEVEAICAREGFTPTWTSNGRLRLVSHHQAVRNHPETGEPVWFNHALVFHLSSGPGEYGHIWDRRRDLRSLFFWQFAKGMVALKRLTTNSDDQALHCTYLDGTEIPDADMDHLRAAVWQNLVIFPWKRGDVVAIDNYSVGHGRLPYQGPRQVVVAWA
ncbi:MAG TPA: TauD/TfdA family dioxygenase [Terriglobales bacterium]|nr:TauD/TfdA family dioxygenase [Terriglobales bacterium]